MIVALLDNGTAVFSRTDQNSAPVAELAAGDELELGETRKDGGAAWFEVALLDGRRGFIAGTTKIFALKRAFFRNDVTAYESPSTDSVIKERYKHGTPFFMTQILHSDGKQWVRIRDSAGKVGFISGDTQVQDSRQVVSASCSRCGSKYAVLEPGVRGIFYKGAYLVGMIGALIGAQAALSAMGYRELAQAHYLTPQGLVKILVAAGILIFVVTPVGLLLRTLAESILPAPTRRCTNCGRLGTVRDFPTKTTSAKSRIGMTILALVAVCAAISLAAKLYWDSRPVNLIRQQGTAVAERFLRDVKAGNVESAFWQTVPAAMHPKDLSAALKDNEDVALRLSLFKQQIEGMVGEGIAFDFDRVEDVSSQGTSDSVLVLFRVTAPTKSSHLLVLAVRISNDSTKDQWFIREFREYYPGLKD